MKFIQFWQRETESHDTWKCIAAATSDIIRGHMLQQGGGGMENSTPTVRIFQGQFYTFEKSYRHKNDTIDMCVVSVAS